MYTTCSPHVLQKEELLTKIYNKGNNVNNSDLFLYEIAETYIDINPIKTSDQSWPLASVNSEKTVFGGKNDIDTVEWGLKLLIMDGMACIAKSISINWSENLKNFERDYLCRFLVYCISNVDVTYSHQASVLYYVCAHYMFSQIPKFLFVKNILRKNCLFDNNSSYIGIL